MNKNPSFLSIVQRTNKVYSERDVVEKYIYATKNIGLWKSEKNLVLQYFPKDELVLDCGTGTGRVAHSLATKLGYKYVVGVDRSQVLIDVAREISNEANSDVKFVVSDVGSLDFPPETFQSCIFAYNGLMMIPGRGNRTRVVKAIFNVLKNRGIFIFTTFDRADKEYAQFWQEEKSKWELGQNDKSMCEYGDILVPESQHNVYMHIPNEQEVRDLLRRNKFTLLDHFQRSSRYVESAKVKKFSADCVFWIAEKNDL